MPPLTSAEAKPMEAKAHWKSGFEAKSVSNSSGLFLVFSLLLSTIFFFFFKVTQGDARRWFKKKKPQLFGVLWISSKDNCWNITFHKLSTIKINHMRLHVALFASLHTASAVLVFWFPWDLGVWSYTFICTSLPVSRYASFVKQFICLHLVF